jgi:hypothetical protein
MRWWIALVVLGCSSAKRPAPLGNPDQPAASDASASDSADGETAAVGTQCTNGVDDDGDGLTDWLDPECTGPRDNDESSFGTGLLGDNNDTCRQDCWFDGNSGSGNDGCAFAGKCLSDTTDPACPYDPAAAADPAQCRLASAKCKNTCVPILPRGCDCVGCCEVFDPAGGLHAVKLKSTCTYGSLSDASKCPVCTPRVDCQNPCGECDVCIGRATAPTRCSDAGAATCPDGLTPCDVASPCPTGRYCLTGCCIQPPS